MQIIWTDLAIDDLVLIREFIRLDNPSAALNVAKKILNTANFLKDNPYLGCLGRVKNTREILISKTSFLVVYQVNEKIEILRVLHSSQDSKNI